MPIWIVLSWNFLFSLPRARVSIMILVLYSYLFSVRSKYKALVGYFKWKRAVSANYIPWNMVWIGSVSRCRTKTKISEAFCLQLSSWYQFDAWLLKSSPRARSLASDSNFSIFLEIKNSLIIKCSSQINPARKIWRFRMVITMNKKYFQVT